MAIFALPVILEWLATAIVILLGIRVVDRWIADPFYKTDKSYTMPFFGQIARLGKGRNIDRRVDRNGLTPAELQLMNEYRASIGAIDPITFNRNREFLSITRQDNRIEAPAFMFPFLLVLLAGEAFGFGLLLAPILAREVTPNEAPYIALVLAFVMAVIAAGLTHGAGRQLYAWRIIGDMRASARNHGVSPFEKKVDTSKNQSIDDEQFYATRFGNRVLESDHDKPSLLLVWVAIAFIISVGIGSAMLRYANLNESVTQSIVVQSAQSSDPFASSSNSLQGMPPSVVSSAKHAQEHVQAILRGEEMMGGVAGIAVLTAIFVFTQIFSTYIGFSYGHLGKGNVKDAMNVTQGFKSYELYHTKWLLPKISTVEARLRKLRKKMYRDHSRPDGQSSISFKEWLDLDPDKHQHYDMEDPSPTQRQAPAVAPLSPPNESRVQAPIQPHSAPQPSFPADIASFASEILDMPQAERVKFLVSLKSVHSPQEMERLRVAFAAEKDLRARVAAAAVEPDDWMKEP